MYTQNSLPTDSTSGPFPIGFNYLNASSISVTRYDTDGITNPVSLPFVFAGSISDDQPSGSTVVLATSLAAGYVLTISKAIDLDTPVLVWNQGAEITQKNLRKTTRNLMEMAQVAWDIATAALKRNQVVLDGIASVIPASVIAAASSIAADRVLAQAAAATAIAQKVQVQTGLALDFGTAVKKNSKLFTITSVTMPIGTKVRVDLTAEPSANHSSDEVSMESIVFTAYVRAANTIDIYAESKSGSVWGIYNVVLTY